MFSFFQAEFELLCSLSLIPHVLHSLFLAGFHSHLLRLWHRHSVWNKLMPLCLVTHTLLGIGYFIELMG